MLEASLAQWTEQSKRTSGRHWIAQWLPDHHKFMENPAVFAAETFSILELPQQETKPSQLLVRQIDQAIQDKGLTDWSDNPLVACLCALAGQWCIMLDGGHWKLREEDMQSDKTGVPIVALDNGQEFSPFNDWDRILDGDYEPEAQLTPDAARQARRLRNRPFQLLCLIFYPQLPKR